jgi:hypothetical protein
VLLPEIPSITRLPKNLPEHPATPDQNKAGFPDLMFVFHGLQHRAEGMGGQGEMAGRAGWKERPWASGSYSFKVSFSVRDFLIWEDQVFPGQEVEEQPWSGSGDFCHCIPHSRFWA